MASVMSAVNVDMSSGMDIGLLTWGVIMDLLNMQAGFYFGELMAVMGNLLFYMFVIHGVKTTKSKDE